MNIEPDRVLQRLSTRTWLRRHGVLGGLRMVAHVRDEEEYKASERRLVYAMTHRANVGATEEAERLVGEAIACVVQAYCGDAGRRLVSGLDDVDDRVSELILAINTSIGEAVTGKYDSKARHRSVGRGGIP